LFCDGNQRCDERKDYRKFRRSRGSAHSTRERSPHSVSVGILSQYQRDDGCPYSDEHGQHAPVVPKQLPVSLLALDTSISQTDQKTQHEFTPASPLIAGRQKKSLREVLLHFAVPGLTVGATITPGTDMIRRLPLASGWYRCQSWARHKPESRCCIVAGRIGRHEFLAFFLLVCLCHCNRVCCVRPRGRTLSTCRLARNRSRLDHHMGLWPEQQEMERTKPKRATLKSFQVRS